MTREKAIQKILSDLHMPIECEDYVIQTMGLLGCDDTVDIDTVKALEKVIKKEFA